MILILNLTGDVFEFKHVTIHYNVRMQLLRFDWLKIAMAEVRGQSWNPEEWECLPLKTVTRGLLCYMSVEMTADCK
jgi:hypothetical protein